MYTDMIPMMEELLMVRWKYTTRSTTQAWFGLTISWQLEASQKFKKVCLWCDEVHLSMIKLMVSNLLPELVWVYWRCGIVFCGFSVCERAETIDKRHESLDWSPQRQLSSYSWLCYIEIVYTLTYNKKTRQTEIYLYKHILGTKVNWCIRFSTQNTLVLNISLNKTMI